jgi:hypothetical protein
MYHNVAIIFDFKVISSLDYFSSSASSPVFLRMCPMIVIDFYSFKISDDDKDRTAY